MLRSGWPHPVSKQCTSHSNKQSWTVFLFEVLVEWNTISELTLKAPKTSIQTGKYIETRKIGYLWEFFFLNIFFLFGGWFFFFFFFFFDFLLFFFLNFYFCWKKKLIYLRYCTAAVKYICQKVFVFFLFTYLFIFIFFGEREKMIILAATATRFFFSLPKLF